MNHPAPVVAAAAQRLIDVYRLDFDLGAERYIIEPEVARRILGEIHAADDDCEEPQLPRSGLLVVQGGSDAQVGLYLDPEDVDDPDTVIEETSHLLCVAWHARQNLPVSRLLLELQGEVDRYVIARMTGRDGLGHFEDFAWAEWMDDSTRGVYATAHRAARRYCRALSARFPHTADTPDLLMELRRFYRASPDKKLHAGAAPVTA